MKMVKDPAPPVLLQTISCGCKKGCQKACGCRKNGLPCSLICKECEGKNCENSKPGPEEEEEDEDEDEDIENKDEDKEDEEK